MRIHENQGDDEQINLMPLIDMVFLLLIFFLVATQIAADEIDRTIQLPTTGAPKALSAPPEQFIININHEGDLKVNGQHQTREELQAALHKLSEDNAKRAGQGRAPVDVLIRADEKSWHKYFAGVASMCHEAGISAINIGYVYEKPTNE